MLFQICPKDAQKFIWQLKSQFVKFRKLWPSWGMCDPRCRPKLPRLENGPNFLPHMTKVVAKLAKSAGVAQTFAKIGPSTLKLASQRMCWRTSGKHHGNFGTCWGRWD